MRTRRSPRNQERLWRELGGKKPAPAKRDEVADLESILARGEMNKRTRGQLERALQRAKFKRAKERT